MNPHLQQKDDHQVQASPYSPSFSTYTTNPQIADIASRVVALDLNEPGFDDDSGGFEFEFAGNMNPDSFPVYPVFNRDLMRDLGSEVTSPAKTIELRSLFFEEDNTRNGYDQPVRLSLSEPELDGVEPETYCLWAPKSPSPSPSASPSRCMKSSSTGSGPPPVVSKTWRLRSLLRRCKSDGKEGLMLVSNNGTKKNSKENKSTKEKSSSSSLSPPPSSPGRGVSSGGRRKSYLPYKPDLLGFFGSPQTLRRINIPPF